MPFYLSLGMSAEEYWHGDPCLYAVYREAATLRREQENNAAWLNGLYVYNALQSVVGMFSWGLGGKKGQKPDPYTEYPFAFTEREKQAEKQRRIERTMKWIAEGQKRGAMKRGGH